MFMLNHRRLICIKLKQARKEARLKQDAVARYLQIPTSAVSAFEAGSRKLDAIELYMLSKLYQKPMDWFFEQGQPVENIKESVLEEAMETIRRRNAKISASLNALFI